jgi:hypothetical protein
LAALRGESSPARDPREPPKSPSMTSRRRAASSSQAVASIGPLRNSEPSRDVGCPLDLESLDIKQSTTGTIRRRTFDVKRFQMNYLDIE